MPVDVLRGATNEGEFPWRYVGCVRVCSRGSGGQQGKHCFWFASLKGGGWCALGR